MFGHDLEVAGDESDGESVFVRLPIPVPSVFAPLPPDPLGSVRDGVGYVRLAAFRETTPRELDDALLSLKGQQMRVLILDLRGNPGGSLPAALQVAQRFLPAGIVFTTQGQTPEFNGRVFSSESGMAALEVPVVLLIDTKTMSAAEAVAAAWKDHGRAAALIGLPTFGKGVIQYPIQLQAADTRESGPRSGVLILTVANMFGPSGAAINGVGVIPHVIEADPARQLQLAVDKAVILAGMR
jgi:C-terminal peptidase prc